MKKIAIIMLITILTGMLLGCSQNEDITKEPDISQIRSICNLATLECYYHNVAKSTKTAGSGIGSIGEVDRKFWVEYTGIARIGIDISEVDIQIKENVVTVKIPDAKLLSINISENDLNEDSFISSGDSWFNKNKITVEDQTAAIKEAQQTMTETVKNDSSLLLSAQNRAKELIENYIIQIEELTGVDYTIEWVSNNDS